MAPSSCCFLLLLQNHRACTTTTSTTRSAYGATLAAWIWRVPVRSAPDASRIKSFATSISPTSPSWSRLISCSSCAASNRNRSVALSLAARAPQRSSSLCRHRRVQVLTCSCSLCAVPFYLLCHFALHLTLVIPPPRRRLGNLLIAPSSPFPPIGLLLLVHCLITTFNGFSSSSSR